MTLVLRGYIKNLKQGHVISFFSLCQLILESMFPTMLHKKSCLNDYLTRFFSIHCMSSTPKWTVCHVSWQFFPTPTLKILHTYCILDGTLCCPILLQLNFNNVALSNKVEAAEKPRNTALMSLETLKENTMQTMIEQYAMNAIQQVSLLHNSLKAEQDHR